VQGPAVGDTQGAHALAHQAVQCAIFLRHKHDLMRSTQGGPSVEYRRREGDAMDATAESSLRKDAADVIVIGGGPAGLNGALMLARSRRSVLVVDSGSPRNAPAEGVHGLLGHDGTPPAELLRRGREEVVRYGGRVVDGEVVSARRDAPAGADPRFSVTLADGSQLTARRLLIATGLRDVLPDVPGLAEHWGRGVVHCPYCHGWEVRDEPVGVLATSPGSGHQALLFRQLTDDLVYFTHKTALDEETRMRFTARGICVVDSPVDGVVRADDEGIAGVRLADGRFVARRVLAVGSRMVARTEGLEGLRLPMEDLPDGIGRRFASGTAGAT